MRRSADKPLASYLDLDDNDLAGGRLWDVTLGVNWYLYPNLRLMFNYIHGDVDDRVSSPPVTAVKGAGNIFQMRVQVDF